MRVTAAQNFRFKFINLCHIPRLRQRCCHGLRTCNNLIGKHERTRCNTCGGFRTCKVRFVRSHDEEDVVNAVTPQGRRGESACFVCCCEVGDSKVEVDFCFVLFGSASCLTCSARHHTVPVMTLCEVHCNISPVLVALWTFINVLTSGHVLLELFFSPSLRPYEPSS